MVDGEAGDLSNLVQNEERCQKRSSSNHFDINVGLGGPMTTRLAIFVFNVGCSSFFNVGLG